MVNHKKQTSRDPARPAAARASAGKARLRLEVHGMTDVGLVRDGNEDALLLLGGEHLFVVADGMGGHSAGEVASAYTIESMKAFYENPDLTKKVRAAYLRARKAKKEIPQSEASMQAFRLKKAVESANLTVFQLAQQHEQLRDMGTTVVAAYVNGSKLHVANVGDSRMYRLRSGKLHQLTEDHSLLNEYIKMNLLAPEEIEAFPYKNVIVRALGLQEAVAVDIFGYTVRSGDQYLLCSDGLTDLVRDAEIRAVLDNAPTAAAACHRLTELAKARGGHDNITTLLVRAHPNDWAPLPPPPPSIGPPSGPAPID